MIGKNALITLIVYSMWWASSIVAAASACSINTTDYKTVDLSTIDISGTGYVVPDTDPNFSYFLNICGGVTNPSTVTCSTEAQGYQYSKTYKLCYPLGQKDTPKVSFLNPSDETAGVKVLHSGISAADGVSRQIAISLKCDTTGPERPTLSFSGESKEGGIISYGFSGTTKTACPPIRAALSSPCPAISAALLTLPNLFISALICLALVL